MQNVYQGVDWRNKSNWGCNGGLNPLALGTVEGMPMSIFELMFVKVKTELLNDENHLAKAALEYSTWLARSAVRAALIVGPATCNQADYCSCLEI